MNKFFAGIVAALLATAAYAQNAGTVTNHAYAIGKGPGVSGYTSLLCASGQLALGSATDPTCRTMSGDATLSATGVLTLATVNANVGTFGSATQAPQITLDAKGRATAATSLTVTPAVGSVTGLGTGVATALGVNIGTAGSFVVNGGALGSPSSAGTIPAHTLGGTVSGGGNQINNVIIGTVTPLAGTFTTGTATTAFSAPNYRAATALALQSNGTTFAGNINTSQQWLLGTTNTTPVSGTELTVSKNVTAAPTNNTGETPTVQIVGVDNAVASLQLSTFGVSGGSVIRLGQAGGTAASPTATAIGQFIGAFTSQGFYTSGGPAYATSGGFVATATENWTSTANGTRIDMYSAPVGGTTAVVASLAGGMSVGTTTDPGAGRISSKGFISIGTVPTGTTGSCTASSFVGGSTAGKFSAALCAGGTFILSALPAAPNGYTCNAQDQTTPADTLKQTANTVSSVTFTATTAAADVIVFQCMGW